MAIRILSFDDEADLEILLTQYFRRKIRKGEYEFSFAHNGQEALEMVLKNKNYDIILSDINMPEMDGLTMLTKINELQNPAMKCIMVSAYGDMGNIRSAMNNGAFDFATKPIDLDDLSVTIEKAVEQINFIKSSLQEHKELVAIQDDLEIAGTIQQAILPTEFPPFPEIADKIDIFASMTPAKDVGGDFYDFFRINDGNLGFVIADVSGKGVPASLFMAVSRTMIKATGTRGLQSSECINIVNNLLSQESVDAMFVTVFYGILDIKTGHIDYTNAGHNPPYVMRSNGSVEQLPTSNNFIVGCFEGFEYRNASLQLNPGDSLVMYTDGVTEAFNEQSEQYGEKRLETLLGQLNGKGSKEIVNEIVKDVHGHAGNAPQSDDITALVIKMNQ